MLLKLKSNASLTATAVAALATLPLPNPPRHEPSPAQTSPLLAKAAVLAFFTLACNVSGPSCGRTRPHTFNTRPLKARLWVGKCSFVGQSGMLKSLLSAAGDPRLHPAPCLYGWLTLGPPCRLEMVQWSTVIQHLVTPQLDQPAILPRPSPGQRLAHSSCTLPPARLSSPPSQHTPRSAVLCGGRCGHKSVDQSAYPCGQSFSTVALNKGLSVRLYAHMRQVQRQCAGGP